MRVAALAMLLVAVSLDVVSGHGHMTSPATRVELAFQNGLDYCPHCVLWDVVDGLEPYQNRPYPGGRPFAQPGEGISEIGPCGKQFGGNDYNRPSAVWGFDVVSTFSAGQVIEVVWEANANHLGVYSYRICQNANITARFLDPHYTPTQLDYDEAEKCFQDGILPCNDPSLGNTNCASQATTFGCNDASWGCNHSPEWFGQAVQGQIVYVDRVRLPSNFRSEHTLLAWRWDAHDTAQLYLNCVDIRIV